MPDYWTIYASIFMELLDALSRLRFCWQLIPLPASVGLALYDGVQVLSELSWSSMDYHTVELAPAVAEALSKANMYFRSPGRAGGGAGTGFVHRAADWHGAG